MRLPEEILILGLQVGGLESYEWDSIPPSLNVANYSVVIYYLPTLHASMVTWSQNHRRALMNAVEGDRNPLASYEDLGLPDPPGFPIDRRLAYRQMISDGSNRTIFVGDPRITVHVNSSEWLSAALIPWFPEVNSDETIKRTQAQGDSLDLYLDALQQTPYAIGRKAQPFPDAGPTLDSIVAAAESRHLNSAFVDVLAEGRGGAMAICVRALIRDDDATIQILSAAWLPQLADRTPIDEMSLLVRGLCGIELTSDQPLWAGSVVDPAEAEVVARIEALQASLAAVREGLAAEELLREELRWLIAMLWATGSELESLVCRAFAELGATIESPASRSEEDAIVVDPLGNRWVLEVKGNQGPVKQADVTNAHKHETEYIHRTSGSFECRALLVVNAERLLPPQERQRFVAQNIELLSHKWKLPVLFTEGLVIAVSLARQGQLDVGGFWELIASADVVVDVPYRADWL